MTLIDLTGQQFGRLTVTDRAPNIGSQTAWSAQCECGTTKSVRGDHLREGRVSSCGCLAREAASARRLVSIAGGTRFGRLVVVGLARIADEAIWYCECDCGQTCEIRGSNLRRGDTKSCGCYQREQRGASTRKAAPGYAAAHIRVRTARGPASAQACVDCGEPAADWSYDGKDPNQLVAPHGICKGLAYSTSLDHYEPRCRPCHKRFDNDRGVFL